MNFIRNLFIKQRENTENTENIENTEKNIGSTKKNIEKNAIKRIFKPTNYKYICGYCNTYNVKIDVLGLTEAFYGSIVDLSGNIHECHDYNNGQVKLLCENNHISIVEYIACCECGWNNNKSS